jgi:hypothetical protein
MPVPTSRRHDSTSGLVSYSNGEIAATVRVPRDLRSRNHRCSDILCADALYTGAPFISTAVAHRMHILVKVKQGPYHLVRDVDGLMATEPLRFFADVTPED